MGTDLSVLSQEEVDAIADEINNHPRKGLGANRRFLFTVNCLQTATTRHAHPLKLRVLQFIFESAECIDSLLGQNTRSKIKFNTRWLEMNFRERLT
jgi:hypothetical protein